MGEWDHYVGYLSRQGHVQHVIPYIHSFSDAVHPSFLYPVARHILHHVFCRLFGLLFYGLGLVAVFFHYLWFAGGGGSTRVGPAQPGSRS